MRLSRSDQVGLSGAKSAERLIWDLRPCVDKAGRPGLYDKVRDVILYNSADGEDFIAGPARGLMLMVR